MDDQTKNVVEEEIEPTQVVKTSGDDTPLLTLDEQSQKSTVEETVDAQNDQADSEDQTESVKPETNDPAVGDPSAVDQEVAGTEGATVEDLAPSADIDFSMTDLDLLSIGVAHWYVVHTYSGHEKKVASALKQRIASMRLGDKILETLVPTQEKIEVRKGKKEIVKEKIFPGYILVRMIMDDYSWLAVRTTPGVTGFVGAGNKPTPISDEEVNAIQKFMTMEAPKYKTSFSLGEAVKIIDGPFAEFLGTVDTIDEAKGKIKVLVSIFGRETPVELDFVQVSKLWQRGKGGKGEGWSFNALMDQTFFLNPLPFPSSFYG